MHVSAIVQYHNLGQLVAVINMYHDFVVHSTGTYISRVYYFELGVLYLQHSVGKKARLSRERKRVKKLKNVSFFLNMARDAMEKNFAGSELKPKGTYCALQ